MPYVNDVFLTIQRHNGTLRNGQPTYDVEADWDTFEGLQRVFAEYVTVGGKERIRGQQVEATSTAVLNIVKTPKTRLITSTDRIKMTGTTLAQYDTNLQDRTFNIVAFGEDKNFLMIEVIELTDDIQQVT